MLERLNQIRDKDLDAVPIIPERRNTINLIKELQVLLFPNYYSWKDYIQEEAYRHFLVDLQQEICTAFSYSKEECHNAQEYVDAFVEQLPRLKEVLLTDIEAIYTGDPAATSKAEVLLCYPGYFAIMIYRIAHILYELHVPILPRIMTEYAHEKTGIDINPGATIGEYFCIDHGTGIVIGETAILGHHVKLYQGVTIGAKSFAQDENGNLVKGGKRHPNIGNYVTIYANATILGGDTYVGDHAIIGGNAWITKSVPEGELRY